LHLGRTRHVHLVAIGGIGMSGIAEILVSSGFTVTGSDLLDSPALHRLRDLGASCFVGHRAEQVSGAHVVVYSSAVSSDNTELVEARRAGIPVISRGEMLAELMRLKRGIAITGSHGKTSTSSLVAEVLHAGDLDPQAVVGGRLLSFGSNVRLGSGPYMVAEADESDGSFRKLDPTWAILTNIDHEHLDHYGSFENLKNSFLDFLNGLPFYGAAIVCMDDRVIREIRPRLTGRVVGYGFGQECELRGTILNRHRRGTHFSWRSARYSGEVDIPVWGDHNVLNALAAIAVALELDITPEAIGIGLARFKGVGRRFEIRGEVEGIMVMDDYGHHPTEIASTLEAARNHYSGPLRVIFQPHRYSRTKFMLDEFAAAFDLADDLIVTEIYAAGEKPIPGIDAGLIVDRVASRGKTSARVVDDRDEIAGILMNEAVAGDLIITLGAGDLNLFAGDLVERLRARSGVS
jgi:UDP-N-acetylmuramate--alanine ligase